jgi:phage shock protein C
MLSTILLKPSKANPNMQRIIQINIAGSLIPIEEDAYLLLRDYVKSLERQFEGEEGRDEIIQDIEYRIAELFAMRLQTGAPAIGTADVQKVVDTLGPAHDLGEGNNYINPYVPTRYTGSTKGNATSGAERSQGRRLYRDPHDKILGGVCGGLGRYFDIDPVIIRLIFAMCFLLAGAGLMVYIVAWIVIPLAKTPQQLDDMRSGEPMGIHNMARNLGDELQDLKKRGEQMSRELREFFSKKK